MASRNHQTVQKKSESYQSNAYITGSAVRKRQASPRVTPRERPSTRPQREVVKRSGISITSAIIMLAAFGILCMMIIEYLSIRSDLLVIEKEVNQVESSISTLAEENEEYYSQIIGRVDLEEIREIAIMDLGMVYATEEQIVTFESQIDDYVEQRIVIGD